MREILSSLIKLVITAYLLFGAYTRFCGFLEKNRKKKIVGALVLIVPTAVIIAAVIVLYRIFGA